MKRRATAGQDFFVNVFFLTFLCAPIPNANGKL
jgi:hypothetical protein